jgi:hypothetical protein
LTGTGKVECTVRWVEKCDDRRSHREASAAVYLAWVVVFVDRVFG